MKNLKTYRLIVGSEVARLVFSEPISGPKECLDPAIKLFSKKLNSDGIMFDNIIYDYNAEGDYTGLAAIVEPKIVED